MKPALEDILQIIRREKPIVVGISTLTPGIRSASTFAEALKARFGNNITIASGGAHLNFAPEFMNRFPCFDFTITGDAEISFVEAIRRIQQGLNLGRIIPGVFVDNLDDLPFPARRPAF